MIRLVQRKLIIPRGDTGTFSVPVISTLNTGDVAVFTIIDMKTKRKVYEKIIDATPDTISIRFEHSDTVNLPVGRYYWDIKFYQSPEWADNELINGTEVDSYYAAYSLPECEIRLTGDNLLTADDSPTTTITPYYLNVLNTTVNDVNHAKTEITELANSANEAATRAQEQADSIKQLSATVTMLGTNDTPTSVYNSETGVLSLGIPAPNSIFGILKTSEDGLVDTYTISYTNGTSTTFTVTNGMIPNLTIGTVQEGATAAASITGTAANPILNLTLPNANVPTRVSQLENDANYAVDANYVHTDNNYTTAEKDKLSGIATGAEVNVNADWNATSGDAAILNKPTNVSAFTNDAGYLTTETDPTVSAWAKAAQKPTYTAAEVGAPTIQQMNEAIANVNTMKIHICAQGEYGADGVPTIQNPDTQTFYLVPGGEGNNLFIEWAYVNGAWERFGSADVDLSNYVQKTDYATMFEPGVIQVVQMSTENSTYNGVALNSSHILRIYPATEGGIKNPFNKDYAPIVPKTQHISTFYGLAKAAGDTTQSASSNAVGTYTDNAKAAIKNMLGITQTLTVTVLTQDNVTVTGQTVTVRADDAAGEVYATAAYEGQPVSFSLPNGFQYYVSVSDTLDHHFSPTTARGIITNTDVTVTLTYSDFSTIHTATDIKAALNAGMDLTDLVGGQITCSKSGETLTWDVVDYDDTNKRITLLLHDAFGTANMVFEPTQALMWCENGLAAGSYTFKWSATQVYFTLTTAIPAGGQLRANNTSFWTYESQSATATLETGTVSTTEIAGATDLGKTGDGLLNHHDRVSYGSNNFAESALYWWLNSDAAANTQRVPVTKFSRAHSYAQPGFLNGLDASFIAALDDTTWLCACNNVYECPESLGGYTKGKGQTYTVTSKIGLASEMEIFGSYGGNQDGSTIYDLYNGATATDRIKYRGTSAQTWWLRSPFWYYANGERHVNSSGNAYYYYAHYSYSVVPACRISVDPSGN